MYLHSVTGNTGEMIDLTVSDTPDGATAHDDPPSASTSASTAPSAKTNIVSSTSSVTDAKLSPKSNFLSYIRDQNLFVYHLREKREHQITFDTQPWIKNGMAEFVAQEEMHRMSGYWWSADESYVAFTHVDESPIEEVQRNEIYPDGVKMFAQRYPYAGASNAVVHLCVAKIAGLEDGGGAGEAEDEGRTSCKKKAEILWVPVGPGRGGDRDNVEGADKDYYLPRVKWHTSDSSLLTFQYQSRDQKTLELKMAHITPEAFAGSSKFLPRSKVACVLREENKDTYVNLIDDQELHFFADGRRFLWCSEAGSGFKSIFVGKLSSEGLKAALAGVEVRDADVEKNSSTSAAGEDDLHEKMNLICAPRAKRIGKLSVSPAMVADLQPVPHLSDTSMSDLAIDDLEYVDEKAGFLYYSMRVNQPATERHLFRAHLQTGRVEQLTTIPGWHTPVFGKMPKNSTTSSQTVLFFDHFSSLAQPSQCSLYEITANVTSPRLSERVKRRQWIAENRVETLPLAQYYGGLQTKPIFGSFPAADDPSTQIYYRLFLPSAVESKSKLLPVVTFVYGGPHVQLCITGSRWSDQHLFIQFLLQQGYCVFTVDNRGSSGRGHRFENSVYRDMGRLEIMDQVRGVEVLCDRFSHLVDPKRIAIYGHSYGGYMALHCLFRSYCARDVAADERKKDTLGLKNMSSASSSAASEENVDELLSSDLSATEGKKDANPSANQQKKKCHKREKDAYGNAVTPLRASPLRDVGFYTFENISEAEGAEVADKNIKVAQLRPRRPLFKCAISGAPVTTWRLYDTHYTERYMGVPNEAPSLSAARQQDPSSPARTSPERAAETSNFYNPVGYESSSVLPFCKYYDDQRSKLLMYHGMADDNVLFQNSTQVYSKLITAGKVFSMLDYPGAKHSMNGEACKRHLYKTIFDFLKREL
eukprot:g7406.t1